MTRISEADIGAALIRYPECIPYSEDKRTSNGWYITKDDNGRYEVGYLAGNGHSRHVYYDNRIDACACFIKHELDDIRLA